MAKSKDAAEMAGKLQEQKVAAAANNPFLQKLISGGVPEGVAVKRLSAPPIIKPAELPDGATVAGILIDVLASRNAKVKTSLLDLQHQESGERFCFPMTAVIEAALAPNAKTPEDAISLAQEHKGKLIVLTKLGERTGAKGKRAYHVFDVGVSEKTFPTKTKEK